MILKALKYGSPNWSIASGATHDDFVAFENINLIVGRNASGKTRFIDAIRRISELFDNEATNNSIDFQDEGLLFETIFQNKNSEYKYILECPNDIIAGTILEERLTVNGKIKLDRSKGELYYEGADDFLKYQNDGVQLAIVRQDSIQQPFFDVLHNWGRNLAHYSFGSAMGKGKFPSMEKEFDGLINFKDGNEIRKVYRKATEQFHAEFNNIVIDDMHIIG